MNSNTNCSATFVAFIHTYTGMNVGMLTWVFPFFIAPYPIKSMIFESLEILLLNFTGLAKTILESSKCFGMYQEST